MGSGRRRTARVLLTPVRYALCHYTLFTEFSFLSHQWPPADKTEKPLTKTDELLAGLLT